MKRSEFKKELKACIRSNSHILHAYKDEEISLGKFADMLIEKLMLTIDDSSIFPPSYTETLDGTCRTCYEVHGWEPENRVSRDIDCELCGSAGDVMFACVNPQCPKPVKL